MNRLNFWAVHGGLREPKGYPVFIWTKPAAQIFESLGRLLKRTTGAGH